MSRGPARLRPIRAAGMGPVGEPVLYWCDTTASQDMESGVQRVTRRLAAALASRGVRPVPVGWDDKRRLVIALAGRKPIMGRAGASWLLVPEIPLSVLGEGLDPVQLGHALGLRVVALVHDLIPVRFAENYPTAVVADFRRYYRMFAQADLVLATTRLVAGHLSEHLSREGLRVPEIAVVPLPAQFADLPRVEQETPPRGPGATLRLLTVSAWEPRKNLARLLRAVRLARERSGTAIQLTLVGYRLGHAAHDAEVEAQLADLPDAVSLSGVGDAALAELYRDCHASVYPSCEEGFGMPVLESLWLGRPCLCHAGSAMAEVAPGGGTLLLDMGEEAAMAAAFAELAEKPDLVERLTREAQARPLRDWADYAADIDERVGLTRAFKL